MQIEPTIRLPDYIAIRFNLRIKHVHRGLLLGTGPLVDPGFEGNILIPLHNLTSEAYRIRGNEGLIWIQFTKTAAKVETAQPPYRRRGVLHPMEDRKADVSISSYFQRANERKPIRSSIPEAVRDATFRAEQAEKSAAQAVLAANRIQEHRVHRRRSFTRSGRDRLLHLFCSIVWRYTGKSCFGEHCFH